MEYVVMIGQLVMSLSILIILHEMGHFFPAKAFKTRVEKFYLFFDPYFSLFKKKIGETEYGIGWLPLGGYVKISGMVDESFDTEALKEAPKPWEFRSKPAWQRLIIMLGGVTVNFLLGFFIFSMVLFTWGEEFMPAANVKYGIHVDSIGIQMGLENGDKIVKIGDKPFDKFSDRQVVRAIVIDNIQTLTIERNGREQVIQIDPTMIKQLSSYKNKNKLLFTERVPFVVGDIMKKTPAEDSDLTKGDSVVAFNGEPLIFFDEYQSRLKGSPSQQIELTVIRDGAPKTIAMTTTEEGTIGVRPFGPAYFFDTQRQDFTFFESIPAGTKKGVNFLSDQIKAFGHILSGKIAASESLGGFASIGSMFGTQWNWERFWTMTAILSLILAFMNLLPIPALDGGHVLFLLGEVVTGRKPSDKFMEYATMVGFILIVALMLYANGLDIIRGCN
ncbi:MAG: RIP metalloprotease RseP [Saprospirales bacterium]|nr:RIP metalloprotease RseP [Saprospirales bacterium]